MRNEAQQIEGIHNMSYKPTIKSDGANTYHGDGTVSYWDVMSQQWGRTQADCIGHNILATMNDDERSKIKIMAKIAYYRYAQEPTQ